MGLHNRAQQFCQISPLRKLKILSGTRYVVCNYTLGACSRQYRQIDRECPKEVFEWINITESLAVNIIQRDLTGGCIHFTKGSPERGFQIKSRKQGIF